MPLAELPQTNKQHAVPQNIMDVEFKLVGDLTMRQFAYLVVCGGIAYFASVSIAGLFKWPIVIGFTLLGVGLAFVPIQERGLDEWIVNFFKAVYSPTQRVWSKEPSIPSAFLYENLAVVKQELITLAPTSSRRKLEEYLQVQKREELKDPLDIPEQEYAMKVREFTMSTSPASAPASVIVDEPPASTLAPLEEDILQTPDMPHEEIMPSQSPPNVEPEPVSEQPVSPTQPESPLPQEPIIVNSVAQVTEEPAPIVKSESKKEKRHRLLKKYEKNMEPAISKPQTDITLAPITPDMHSGRRFVNLLPSEGELVLPIRGERVIKTSDQVQIEEDITEKAERLQQLLSQIRKGRATSADLPDSVGVPAEPVSIPDTVEETAKVNVQAEEIAQSLEQEQQRLAEEIETLKITKDETKSASEAVEKEELIKRLQVEKERTEADFQTLRRQLLDLQERLKAKGQFDAVSEASSAIKPSYATIQPLTTKPNVVSGIVKRPDGTVIDSLLLIIKNDKNEAVRAFRTNSLGQFSLTTPLSNGVYTIEVSPNSNDLTFDIISIEAKGAVIPPIEIKGKVGNEK